MRGDFAKAIECFDKALGINEELVDVLNAKSRALIMLGRAADESDKDKKESKKHYDSALKLALSILSKDSNDGVALGNVADALNGLGRQKDTGEFWDKALKALEKKNLDAKLQPPKDTIMPALGARHKRATEWNALGLAQSALGDDDGATSSFNNAIKNDPYFIDAWFNKGLAFYAQEMHKKALACYKHAKSINPNYPFLKAKEEEAIVAAALE